MPRIKIEISGRPLTKVSLPVRITDINYGNHTGNDALVGLIQEARMAWLNTYNYTELDIGGKGLIMSGLAIEFKNESFYADVLEIQLYAEEITKKSFNLLYAVSTTRNNNKIEIAKAKTEMVCFDYTLKQVASLPDAFMKILSGDNLI